MAIMTYSDKPVSWQIEGNPQTPFHFDLTSLDWCYCHGCKKRLAQDSHALLQDTVLYSERQDKSKIFQFKRECIDEGPKRAYEIEEPILLCSECWGGNAPIPKIAYHRVVVKYDRLD